MRRIIMKFYFWKLVWLTLKLTYGDRREQPAAPTKVYDANTLKQLIKIQLDYLNLLAWIFSSYECYEEQSDLNYVYDLLHSVNQYSAILIRKEAEKNGLIENKGGVK